MTNTPLPTKIAVLSRINLDYRDEDDQPDFSRLGEFFSDESNRDVFALATSIEIGYAEPTESGIEILNVFFDEVCEILGKNENILYSVSDIY